MARAFSTGRFQGRGYYRDQTFMMALNELRAEYFAQLYAHF